MVQALKAGSKEVKKLKKALFRMAEVPQWMGRLGQPDTEAN